MRGSIRTTVGAIGVMPCCKPTYLVQRAIVIFVDVWKAVEQAPKGIEKVTEGLLPGPAQGRVSLEFMSRCMRRTFVGEKAGVSDEVVEGDRVVRDGVVEGRLPAGDGVAFAGKDKPATSATALTRVVAGPASKR